MTQRALQRGLTATPIRGATDWPAFACEPAGDTLPNMRSMQHSTAFLYLSSFEALRIIFNAFGPTFCAETQPCPVFRKKDATLSGHSLFIQMKKKQLRSSERVTALDGDCASTKEATRDSALL